MCVWQRHKHRCGHFVKPDIDSLHTMCDVAKEGKNCGITSYSAGDRNIDTDCADCKK